MRVQIISLPNSQSFFNFKHTNNLALKVDINGDSWLRHRRLRHLRSTLSYCNRKLWSISFAALVVVFLLET